MKAYLESVTQTEIFVVYFFVCTPKLKTLDVFWFTCTFCDFTPSPMMATWNTVVTARGTHQDMLRDD